MRFLLKLIYLVLFIPILLGSCTAHKKIPYIIDAQTISSDEFAKTAKVYDAVIMPKDILSITVNEPTSEAKAVRDFNLPLVPLEANDAVQMRISGSSPSVGGLQNYIVDNKGYITFPILGDVKIGGLTKQEAEKKLYSLIYPQYLNEKPIINIRFLNYKVAVLGEVARPGIYTSDNEQMTLFDALAMAGDMTIHGDRRTVKLIREGADGELSVRAINLQDKEILLDKDIYYLQQNDKIYVQPNKAKGNNSSFGTLETLALSGISLLISVVSILTR